MYEYNLCVVLHSLFFGHFPFVPQSRLYVSSVLLKTYLWTSLGLNQGPPDYESVALTN